MIQRYFRDVRRRVERLEESRPKPPPYFEICWVDEGGVVTTIANPYGLWDLDVGDESEDDCDTFSSPARSASGAEPNPRPVEAG